MVMLTGFSLLSFFSNTAASSETQLTSTILSPTCTFLDRVVLLKSMTAPFLISLIFNVAGSSVKPMVLPRLLISIVNRLSVSGAGVSAFSGWASAASVVATWGSAAGSAADSTAG